MSLGYTSLYRKIWKNKVLNEKGRAFSRREAWLHLVNVVASGVNNDTLKRGELISSYRYLAKAWLWDTGKVYRFIQRLIDENMLQKVKHQPKHLPQHLKITNYNIYNPIRNTNRNTNRNKIKKGKTKIKEKTLSQDSLRLSTILYQAIIKRDPKCKAAQSKEPIKRWAKDIDKIIRLDGRSADDCMKVIEWCQASSFWAPNILSGRKLREKFDTLYGQMKAQQTEEQKQKAAMMVGAPDPDIKGTLSEEAKAEIRRRATEKMFE